MSEKSLAVIGGGPAGLMAAEAVIGGAGPDAVEVDLYDAMPSVGRKFLLAGKGGLNLTHSEPREPFLARYGARRDRITPFLDAFGAEALRAWIRALGIETFAGSSGRDVERDQELAVTNAALRTDNGTVTGRQEHARRAGFGDASRAA